MKNKKVTWIASFSILFIFLLVRNFSNKFIPTAKTCGAAISRQQLIVDTFDRGIQCLLAGYKNIYLGNLAGILYEYMPKQIDAQEIHVLVLDDGEFILYNAKAEENARLLAQQTKEKYINPYLDGKLLEYTPEDIKFFYERNKRPGYEQDKVAAEQWLKRHKNIVKSTIADK